ncbi:putative protein RTM1 [Glarea lozoyensis 74030]|nr:putative protein RTM1 [Glarea lozoyensis 74030]
MALFWVILDIASFIIQIGGGLLVVSDDPKVQQNGLHIYTAGLALQLFFILVFSYLVFEFWKRVSREGMVEHKVAAKKLVITLYCSLTLISIRIIYRLLEFASDFNSALTQELWNHEVYQYALDATPMFFALIVMIIVHPGTVLPGDLSTFKPISTSIQQSQMREKDAPQSSSIEA